MRPLLVTFVVLRLLQQAAEHALLALNRRFTSDPGRREEAARLLRIPPAEMEAAAAYAADRQRLQLRSDWAEALATLAFLVAGGLAWAESVARSLGRPFGLGPVGRGLLFLGILGAAEALFDLPFALYDTFWIEEKHGFNRQTLRGFFFDLAKGLALATALGGAILAALLVIMERAGPLWWVWASLAMAAFIVLTAWIYPTLLAPLFNRFTLLPEGELRERILELLRRIGFRSSGLLVMDASRRTAHGNAYFTGLFRAKRIVLFDTLLEALSPPQVVAVLAHELGHFKLHHVRAGLLRRMLETGVLFYALSRCLSWTAAYAAFGLSPSNAGALVVFGLWFGLARFLLRPLESALSRRQEFAADAFALGTGAEAKDLGEALLKLREKSRLLPLTHPLYSRVYHSHPPLLERLRAMGAV